MKVTEDVWKNAAELGIAVEDGVEKGMEENPVSLRRGNEIYAKA